MSSRHPSALTLDEARDHGHANTVTQVVINPALLAHLQVYFDRRGIDLVPYSRDGDEDDVPTYVTSPRLG